MARKAKKKPSKQKLRRRLIYLLPALLLPVLVIGGLYAGAIMLGDPATEQTAETSVQSAENTKESMASQPNPPTEPAALPPSQQSAPLDLEKLRVTDTLVRDGGSDGVSGYLPDNSSLPAKAEEKPEAVALVQEAPVPAEPTEPEKPEKALEKEVIPPLWLRNATASRPAEGQPMVAVVLDDIGPNLKNARRAITLPAPLTLAFLPYANHLEDLSAKARAAGHELLVHMPMEPEEKSQNPGENALLTGLAPEELERRLKWSLARFSGYVGLNNHMGSRFTKSEDGMRLVMAELARRGLLFLDSRTIAESRAEAAAKAFRVPFAQRDIFLDNDHRNRDSIRNQLAKLEALARRQGFAVAIGHPHSATLEVLAEWLPQAAGRGVALVPISEIVKQRLLLAESTQDGEVDAGRARN